VHRREQASLLSKPNLGTTSLEKKRKSNVQKEIERKEKKREEKEDDLLKWLLFGCYLVVVWSRCDVIVVIAW